MIIRNAFGGAYAAYNSQYVGADRVFAMPMARVAVMGPGGGVEFVYKDRLRQLEADHLEAAKVGDPDAQKNLDAGRAQLVADYEDTLMNPKEALALGSVSRLVMPGESRRVLASEMDFLMRTYEPKPMVDVQREHE